MGSTAAIVTSAAGAGFGAVSSIEAGHAQQTVANYNAQVDLYNSESAALDAEYKATISDTQASDAIARGQVDETNQRLTTKASIGSERAQLATQGVDIKVGSALDVQGDMAYLGEIDAQTIRVNAAREAWGYSTTATNERFTAATLRQSGKLQSQGDILAGEVAAKTGDMNAVGALVGGAGSLLAKKYGFNKTP